MHFDRLTTPRLLLRRLHAGDARRLRESRIDPHAVRMQGWPGGWSLADAEGFVALNQRGEPGTPGAWFQFALADPADDALLGDVGLFSALDGSTHRVGYTLHPDARGRGLATEAVRAVLGLVFDELGGALVEADTLAVNAASRAVLERCGFQLDERPERAVAADEVAYLLRRPADGAPGTLSPPSR
ncbi:MAG: GNAT family N-acetyltransferase [Acidimicrobiia bacterium]|nr:GNAT family N-acetyltransferase [Acidimicrobiia bacterium]